MAQEPQNALGMIYALRYNNIPQGGGSDKVWAGAVVERGDQALFVSCWGRAGAKPAKQGGAHGANGRPRTAGQD